MLVVFFRTIIIYIMVIIFIRLMGKRQIGELQPSELVITIMISEVVSIPMQDSDIPLVSAIIPAATLVALEIILSYFNLKFEKFRALVQGHSLIIIRNGVIDQKQLKRLRMTVDDLMDSLRKKDVFDINTVEYAIIETDGSLSVLLKPEHRNPSAQALGAVEEDTGLPCTVVIDGKVIESDFKDCGMTREKLEKILKNQKIPLEKIFLMVADKSNFTIIERNDNA